MLLVSKTILELAQLFNMILLMVKTLFPSGIHFVIGFMLLVYPVLGWADVLCKSDVSYKWKKGKETEGQEASVLINSFEAKAKDEVSAKDALAAVLVRERSRALEICRRNHENVTHCVATKYAAISSTLQKLPFSARKHLEEAVVSDCTSQQGECLSGASTDPKCHEVLAAGESGASGDTGSKEGAGKEEKGKKKK